VTASEKAVLGHIVQQPADAKAIFALVEPSMFYGPGMASAASIVLAMVEQGIPVDLSTVTKRLDGAGTAWLYKPNAGTWVHDLMQAAPWSLEGALWHAEQVRETYAGRQLQMSSQQVADALREGSTELDSAVLELESSLLRTRAAMAASRVAMPMTAGDLLATDPPMRWRVPGLIGWREKIIWTGLEGLGKTELGAQLAICAAAGLHPFSGELHEPVRVLVVDCENELDSLRRRYRRIIAAVERFTDFDRSMLMVESIEAGMNMTRPDDFSRLRRVVDAARPGILLIGPLSKLAVGLGMNDEENAVGLCSRLDTLRVEHDLATLTEAHPSKEKGFDGQRAPAPRGSSYFLGWPSIGFGLRPHEDYRECDPVPVSTLKQFRGNREERDWPLHIERQKPWPGIPVLPFAGWYGDRRGQSAPTGLEPMGGTAE
jgi:AAA domain-containing protein/DnaB helicase-like protein